MGLALVLSLAINLFIGGMVIGRLLHPPRHPDRPPAPSAMLEGPGGVFEGLGGATRNRVFGRMKADSSQLRGSFDDLQTARETVGAAMVAEPFDRAALEAAFAGLRTSSKEAQATLHGLLVDAAAEMSVEERSALLRRMSRRGRGHDR